MVLSTQRNTFPEHIMHKHFTSLQKKQILTTFSWQPNKNARFLEKT